MANADAARIADLEAKLKAREGYPAYGENCIALRAEIARLKAKQGK